MYKGHGDVINIIMHAKNKLPAAGVSSGSGRTINAWKKHVWLIKPGHHAPAFSLSNYMWIRKLINCHGMTMFIGHSIQLTNVISCTYKN